MAEHKNQHFVPQTYLRPFSQDEKSIGLVLLNTGKVIDRAGIAGQCQDDYFYGKDLVVEKALQNPEGRYGTLMKTLEATSQVSAAERPFLCQFSYLMRYRNEQYVKKAKTRSDLLASIRPSKADMVPDHLMASFQVITALRNSLMLGGLEFLLISNETDTPFITSDNPSVALNRFWEAFGPSDAGWSAKHSGFSLFMPLSARHYVVCYDPDIYTFEGKVSSNSRTRLTSTAAVEELNALQVLSASNCIYFGSGTETSYVTRLIAEHAPRRSCDYGFGGFYGSTAGDGGELSNVSALELHNYPQGFGVRFVESNIIPSTWPSILRIKNHRRVGPDFIRRGAGAPIPLELLTRGR
jgi:hypothetical protein